MKTPSGPVARKAKKPLTEWVPPSPFTPMPSYDSMATPELKVSPIPTYSCRFNYRTCLKDKHVRLALCIALI